MRTSQKGQWFIVGIPALVFIVVLLVSLAAVGLVILVRLGLISGELP